MKIAVSKIGVSATAIREWKELTIGLYILMTTRNTERRMTQMTEIKKPSDMTDEEFEKKCISRSFAMKCKCEDCMGLYKDGRVDCEVTGCPLYPWMPYRKLDASFEIISCNLERSKNKREKGRLLASTGTIGFLRGMVATTLHGDSEEGDFDCANEGSEDSEDSENLE